MILSGFCAFLIYSVSSAGANLAVSCAFGLVSTMGFNALDCLGIELFPTQQRSVYSTCIMRGNNVEMKEECGAFLSLLMLGGSPQ